MLEYKIKNLKNKNKANVQRDYGGKWRKRMYSTVFSQFLLKHGIIPLLNPIRVPIAAAAAAKSLQSCPTLCDPIDGSPSGSTVPGILQARTLEWVALSFSNAWKWKVKVKSLSRVQLFTTPWTAAHQAPPSMGFSRQEYWSGLPLPSPHESLESFKQIHLFSLSLIRV